MMKRYDLITNYRCGSSIEEMERNDEDGDWIRFEDVEALIATAAEFVRYWTTDRTPDGCGMCGGIPHSTTCYVGRMAALLGSGNQAAGGHSDPTRRSEAQ